MGASLCPDARGGSTKASVLLEVADVFLTALFWAGAKTAISIIRESSTLDICSYFNRLVLDTPPRGPKRKDREQDGQDYERAVSNQGHRVQLFSGSEASAIDGQ